MKLKNFLTTIFCLLSTSPERQGKKAEKKADKKNKIAVLSGTAIFYRPKIIIPCSLFSVRYIIKSRHTISLTRTYMHTKKTADLFHIIVLSAVLSATLGYALADWTPPTSNPPQGNPPPPINVGPVSQVREGALFINNWLTAAKAQTASTVAGDDGHVLVTKDYMEGYVESHAGSGSGNNASNGGGSGDSGIQIYKCPFLQDNNSALGAITTCVGQISTQSTCTDGVLVWEQTHDCTLIGELGLYVAGETPYLRMVSGTGCGECPYGADNGDVLSRSCYVKNKAGNLLHGTVCGQSWNFVTY